MTPSINKESLSSWNRFNRIKFGLYAPVYDGVGGLFGRARKRAMGGLEVGAGKRLLLAGAGTGCDLPFIPAATSVDAVDLSPAMLRRLSRRANRLGIQVVTQEMDLENLDFPDESFDSVALHFVLAVVPDPRTAFLEALRVTRVGGRISVLDSGRWLEKPPGIVQRGANALFKFWFTDFLLPLGSHTRSTQTRERMRWKVGPMGLFHGVVLEKIRDGIPRQTGELPFG